MGTTPATDWDGPIIQTAHAISDTTVDLILAGHAHVTIDRAAVGDFWVVVDTRLGAGGPFKLSVEVKGIAPVERQDFRFAHARKAPIVRKRGSSSGRERPAPPRAG